MIGSFGHESSANDSNPKGPDDPGFEVIWGHLKIGQMTWSFAITGLG